MILLFDLILLTSLPVIGWTIITQPSMGLGFIRERYKDTWLEPFIICHWCQPSTWSVFGYGFAIAIGLIDSFSWKLIFMYPLVVCGSSLVCGMTWAAYQLMNKKIRYFSNMEQLTYWDIDDRKKQYNHRNGKN